MPGAKPGERRGGRQKGTPNKTTLALMETLEREGYNPVAELIEVARKAAKEYARAEEMHDAIQARRAERGMIPLSESTAQTYLTIMEKCASDLLPYLYPKRKAVEISGVDGQDVFKSFADMVKEVAGK
jgi:hypothetical protein